MSAAAPLTHDFFVILRLLLLPPGIPQTLHLLKLELAIVQVARPSILNFAVAQCVCRSLCSSVHVQISMRKS